MAKRFKGTINIDIRDSTPDWEPYEEPKAPEGAPNVLYIVWDDVGYGALDVYGGLIEAPNMKRLADKGLIYTQFHTTALCSPTRACLLTGRNATSNGMACIEEASTGFPGSSGRIPFENALISEVLGERGWNTYALGKWHLTPPEESNLAGSKREWPVGRGFERYYGFLGGETDQWHPELVYDNHPMEQPYQPSEGYHLSKDLADRAIQFVRDAKAIAPEKPWLMYFCPGCGHAPHQVWKEWADRYKGRFDMGYEKYRETVLANQKKMGLVPADVDLPPLNPYIDAKSADGKPWPEGDTVRPWDSLSPDEKRLFSRMAEVYAGFVSYTDAQIGRLLDYLQESGQLENTIVVAVSDNGASGEGGPNGSVNENRFFNGVPDRLEDNLKHLDDLGSEYTYNHYPIGWAMAFNTPFKLFKRYAGHEGGIADACIIAWPQGMRARGEIRHQYIHAIDIVPTLYDCLGIAPPDLVKGYAQSPLEGASFRSTFDDPAAPAPRQTQFYSMLGTRGIWHRGWHANTVHAATPSDWGHFDQDRWELYHLDQDRNQMRNLADQEPARLEQLKNTWFAAAGRFFGVPLDDRSAVEILSAPRPQLAKPRTRYVYYPDGTPVPEVVAVNLRGRPCVIAVEVAVETPEAEGVLFSQGSRFGGHSLYIKDRKLHYAYNWLGELEQKLTSSEEVPSGRCILGVRFRPEGQEDGSPVGSAVLYINDRQVAEERIRVQPGSFGVSGTGLVVGRSGPVPVTGDYEAPFSFTGGVVGKATVDVSGEPLRDLERELAGAFMRE
ncbi:MAG: arylsulfatase [Anaerolineae bacterium]